MGNSKPPKQLKEMPFFSRFLEGQARVEPEESVRIDEQRQLAYKRSEKAPLQTRKFPSDHDELDLCLHYGSEEEVPPALRGRGRLVTLKFPSDNDEEFWQAEYVEQSDIPRAQKVNPKATNVKLKKRKKK